MRQFLTAGAAAVVLALSANTPNAFAHRLDECLVASRLDIRPDGVALTIDVRPGIAVLPTFMAWVDRDEDGRISCREARRYALDLLADCQLALDGERCRLTLASVAIPAEEALAEGEGTLRIAANARLALAPGDHRLSFYCAYHPEGCVYLTNALLPVDPAVEVGRQCRDRQQQRLEVDFKLADSVSKGLKAPAFGAGFRWLLLAGAVALLAIAVGRLFARGGRRRL